MKLLRFGQIGSEKPGVLGNDGEIRDLSGLITDIDASALSDQALQKLRDADLSKLPVVSGHPRIGACVGNIGKMICIGLNYSDPVSYTHLTLPTILLV